METHAALVRTDGVVELDAVCIIDLHLTLIVHPCYTEADHPVGGGQPLQQCFATVALLVLLNNGIQGLQNLFHCLMEFRLGRVLGDHSFINFIYITHKMHLL